MQPRSPTSSSGLRVVRGAFALLLALFVAATAAAQPVQKEPEKKEAPKLPEIKWPTEINGKDVAAVLKDLEDPDPTVREVAARTLPGFGPGAAKTNVSKALIRRMTAERDPGVRGAVYFAVGANSFENEIDNREALRLLVNAVNGGSPGSALRLAAIQALGQFGDKGEGAIAVMTGNAMNDPSYVTRQAIANVLGRIGFHETAGPNMRALTALADHLARDESAAVRMDAIQALFFLGPPWLSPRKVDAVTPPVIDTKSADKIVSFMRARVGDPKLKIPPREKDKQVEIWARLVMMRFDPKEITEENLDAIAQHLTGAPSVVKLQALQALGLMGESAAKKLNDVVRVMEDPKEPFQITVSSIQVIGAMGAGAKPALPNLQKMVEAKKKELAAKKLELAKKKDDLQLTGEVAVLEELIKLLEAAIKHIESAKMISPADAPDPKVAVPPKKP